MHILVVEALLIAIYSTWGTSKYLLIDIRKPCRSKTCLVRYSWSLSSCAFPAGSCPAEVYDCTFVRAYEPANSNRHAVYSQQEGFCGHKRRTTIVVHISRYGFRR